MARTKGTANLSASLEPLAGAPLDARDKVPAKADLTASGNFPYHYVGMETYVVAENKKYRLIGNDPTVLENWEEVGSGGSTITIDPTPTSGSTNAVESGGTYDVLAAKADLVNGKIPVNQLPNGFDNIDEGTASGVVSTASGYTATSFTKSGESSPVTPQDDVLYIDITLNVSFRWTGTEFISIGGGGVSLGETSETAYRGDRGKTAYDFSQAPYTSNPAMNGVASAGSSTQWAKGDHVHPHDSAKADAFSVGDGLKKTGTTLSTDNMPSADLSEVVDPLPGVMSRRHKYSEDEQVVGEWIDGKPLYEKTIYISNLPNATYSDYPLNINDLERAWIVTGFVFVPSSAKGSIPIECLCYNDNNYYITAMVLSSGSIRIRTNADRSASSAYVTIHYIKTTD